MIFNIQIMTEFTVAFAGLPSSGKSSIINALIGRRKLESGVCRTTVGHNILKDIITDDNNNNFGVIDLPGICDSEENNTNFTELTYAHITNANLVIWVSDVNKAFITTHEVAEYNKLKKHINDLSQLSGTIYYLAIMLSKCDKDCSISDKKNIKKSNKTSSTSEEIEDSDEDTDLNDLIKKVKEKFVDETINNNILLFNAYGRSYHNKKSSDTLVKFIKKMIGVPTKHNIKFDITKYMENHELKQERSYYDKFSNMFAQYLSNSDFNMIKKYWNKLTIENCNKIIKELCEMSNNNIEDSLKPPNVNIDTSTTNLYTFLSYISESIDPQNNELLDLIKDKIIYWQLYLCKKDYNTIFDFTNNLQDFIRNFLGRRISTQKHIFENLLTKYNFASIKDVLSAISSKVDYYVVYDIEQIFNNMIDEIDINIFKTFYSRMMELEYDDLNGYTFNSKIINDKYLTITEYFAHIEKLDDLHYILLNKLQILSCQRENRPINNHFKGIIQLDLIPWNRKILNDQFVDSVNIIMSQIYSNILIQYDCNKLYDFEPIDKNELKYMVKFVDVDDN